MVGPTHAMQNYLRVARAAELENPKDRFFFRFFEILPGALTWLTFGAMIAAARFLPVYAAVFVILFDLYWFLRTIYLSLHLRMGFLKMREHAATDWNARLEELSQKDYAIPLPSWRELWHLVIFPMYREPYEIVRASFSALAHAGYSLERVMVVLSLEERAGEDAKETSRKIKEEFGRKFGHFLVTVHPAGLPGEIPGKASNEHWAVREAVSRMVDPSHIPSERVIVSAFDVDTAVIPGFFSCLSYHYLTAKNPLRASFQPVPLFINNVWQAPAFARIMGFSSTFWQMMQQARPERLITFSSHSMGLQPLIEIGFWQPNVVSEDSRIFFNCLLFYDGDWEVIPLFFPIAMDANFAGSLWRTLKNQYSQQRRWGYGAENIPYLFFGFLKNKKFPSVQKWHYGFSIVEGFHSWATNAILIFFLGWLPLVIGKKDALFSSGLLSYNLLSITEFIMTVAMVGLATSAILSVLLLPPKPPQFGRWKYLLMFFQWILMPFTMIFLSTIPAIDAQTRLMLGRYLGFWWTPKSRREITQGALPAGT